MLTLAEVDVLTNVINFLAAKGKQNNYLQHGLPIKAYNLRPSYRYLAWLRGTTKPTFILHFAERPF